MQKISKRLLSFLAAFILPFTLSPLCLASSNSYSSTNNFTYLTFPTLTLMAHISFDVTANSLSDGFIGIASSSVTPSDYSQYAVCFRLLSGGYFDANDGSGFSYDEKAEYSVNKTYHVKIDADISNQIFNAYVTNDSGKTFTVAKNHAFRASASDLGKLTARGGYGVAAGLYKISNLETECEESYFSTFTLPNYYDESMVLQRGKPHLVTGSASEGCGEITVSLSRGSLSSSVSVTPEDGAFSAYLDPLPASLDPYTLTVSTADMTRTIENVYIGDVYLLAGQSNMAQNYEYQTTEQLGNGVTTSNLPTLISDERIKFIVMNTVSSSSPTFDIPLRNGSWKSLTDSNNKTLSYIGMFFAAERLEEEPNVPIGLICAAWNGTAIDRWIRLSDDNKTLDYTPSGGDIFNNHIAPIAGFPISAVLWYQGESDASDPIAYSQSFPALIRDYRALWGEDDLPFLFVQLARYSSQDYSPQREAQRLALSEPNTGMAVILDSDQGTYNNIHPLGKETVAHRLALLAKKYVCGEAVTAEGPLFESAEIKDGAITVSFREDSVGSGLVIQNTYGASDTALCEFEIASATGAYYKADAVINPDNTVTVSSTSVPDPAYVRYAYSAVPENPNLFNSEGLPASPFTTDTRYHSADSFITRGTYIEDSDVQIASFTAVAFKNGIDGVIALTALENTVSAWNSCGVCIRFGTDGFFGFRDGSASDYTASSIPYSAGVLYDFRIIIDFTSKTYSVTVDDGSGAVLLCRSAAFRSDALEMTNAGRLLVRGGYGSPADQFAVSDYSISVPEQNACLSASADEETVFFAASPSHRAVAASYEDSALISVSSAPPQSGVAILPLPTHDEEKLFIWNENLQP